MSLIIHLENIFSEKMSGFTKCPNCAKEGLTVPLSEDENGLVCALCGKSSELSSVKD
jgi:hypothetical protein